MKTEFSGISRKLAGSKSPDRLDALINKQLADRKAIVKCSEVQYSRFEDTEYSCHTYFIFYNLNTASKYKYKMRSQS